MVTLSKDENLPGGGKLILRRANTRIRCARMSSGRIRDRIGVMGRGESIARPRLCAACVGEDRADIGVRAVSNAMVVGTL